MFEDLDALKFLKVVTIRMPSKEKLLKSVITGNAIVFFTMKQD